MAKGQTSGLEFSKKSDLKYTIFSAFPVSMVF